MPCNQTCGYANNCTWIIILAFIVIWFFCGSRGGCGGVCGNQAPAYGGGCGTCGGGCGC